MEADNTTYNTMNNFHVLPDGSKWKLTEADGHNHHGNFDTKIEAVERAMNLVAGRTGSLKIHRADGTIEEERTYPRAGDPVKTPG